MTMPLIVAAAGPVKLDIMALLLILVAAWAAGWVAERIGMPAVLGELLAGVLLGPPALGLLDAGAGLEAVAELGILLMMLAIGMHVDLDDVMRAKVPGVLAAIGGFITPAALGTGVLLLFGYDLLAAVFVGVAIGVTSLATKSRILADLDLFGTRIAHVLVAGALLSDTTILIVFAIIMGFVELGTFDLAGTIRVAVEVTAFLAITITAGRTLLPRLAKKLTRRNWDTTTNHILVILGVGFGFGVLAETAGLHALLGTFLAGMFLRAAGFTGPSWREAKRMVEGVTMRMLAPVFFVMAGFAISFEAVVASPGVLAAVFLAAALGKILGTALFYLPSGHGLREGLVVGAGMNGRGAVEIIVAGIGMEAGVIDPTLFTVLVFTAIGTTATVPPLLTWGVQWLRNTGDLPADDVRDGVLIIGAGPLGRLFADLFDEHRQVSVVDGNPYHIRRARDAGVRGVCGNALDESVLDDAEAAAAGTIIAVTPNSEVNVLAAALAQDSFGIDHAVAALGDASEGLRQIAGLQALRSLHDSDIDVEQWEYYLSAGEAVPVCHTVYGDAAALETAGEDSRRIPLVVDRDGRRSTYSEALPLQNEDDVWILEHVPAEEPADR